MLTYDSRENRGLEDLVAGLRLWRNWSLLAWHEVRMRYRRSVIGPFWLTISTAVTVFGLAIVFGKLLGQPLADLLPFVAVGLVVWSLIASVISDSTSIFTGSQSTIRNVTLPLSLQLYKVLFQNLIIFAHNAVVIVAMCVLLRTARVEVALLSLPGLALLMVNLAWMSIALALLATRYGDVSMIVANMVQTLFFLTPVIWPAAKLGDLIWIARLNPFASLVDIVREPLLDRVPDGYEYAMVVGCAILGWTAALWSYQRTHARIAYWI